MTIILPAVSTNECSLALVVSDFVTPWAVARQAPQSMRVPRQECWSGLLFSFSRDLPNPVIKPSSSLSPALQVDSLPTEPPGKPLFIKRLLTNLFEKHKFLILFGYFVINSKLLGNPRTEEPGGLQSMGSQKSWT